MRTGLISLNGAFSDVNQIKEHIQVVMGNDPIDTIIGVDGGCKLLMRMEITPDILLGDFDSIENLNDYQTLWKEAKVQTFPPEKDFTDAEIAFEEINKNKELDRIVVIGGLGGRADHMMSVLHLASRYKNIILIDEQNIIETIECPYYRTLERSKEPLKYISLIPFPETLTNITLIGFKYPLNHAIIQLSQTIGISNEIVEDHATISIECGKGFLVRSRDKKEHKHD